MKDDNKKKDIVFILSAAIALVIALWGIIDNQSFAVLADGLMKMLKQRFSWLYLGVMFLFVVFALVLAFSRYGKIRLGEDGEKPEYSNVSWFAMLFAAGMGIGLVFWGVAERLSHVSCIGDCIPGPVTRQWGWAWHIFSSVKKTRLWPAIS